MEVGLRRGPKESPRACGVEFIIACVHVCVCVPHESLSKAIERGMIARDVAGHTRYAAQLLQTGLLNRFETLFSHL